MGTEMFKPLTIGVYEVNYVRDARFLGKDHSYIDIRDETREGVQLFPDEALQLLEWLQQNKEFLQLSQVKKEE